MDLITHRTETKISRWLVALTDPFNAVGSHTYQLTLVHFRTERSDLKHFAINPNNDAVWSVVGVECLPAVDFVEIKHDHNR